jgi:hypothetical protein
MHISCYCKYTGGLRVQYGVYPSAERGRSAQDVNWSAPRVHRSDNPLHICNVIALLSLVFLPWPHLCLLSVSLCCFQQSVLCIDCLQMDIIICRL